MVWERCRQLPAMVVAVVALFVALGGSVYAATRIDGHTVRVKSLPGNRLVPRSLPANRLRPGTIPGGRLAPGSVTGREVDAASLGEVPEATHARQAEEARHAGTALVAGSADEAQRLDSRTAGCAAGAREFAGGCWEIAFSDAAVSAPDAAAQCAGRGGELPSPLALKAFAAQPGIAVAAGGEWTGDVVGVSGPGLYSVTAVLPGGVVDQEDSAEPLKFRCVLPLLS